MIIHSDKLKLLFWLRWKMFIRAFSTGPAQIVGTIFLIIFMVPFASLLAFGTYAGYRYLPAPANEVLLFLVLTLIYVVWIILPLLEFNGNEGLNVSKLSQFPLTRWELMASLIFSTLLDIPMFGLVLMFLAVILGWAISLPMIFLSIITMLIFYVQVVAASQLVLALLMRTLQSRRYRDLSIIIIVVFSSSCGILSQFIGRFFAARGGGALSALQNTSALAYLQWGPPGMAARAIQEGAHGNWGLSIVWLVALLIVSFIFLYLWQMVIVRSLASSEGGGSVGGRRSRRAASTGQPVAANEVATSQVNLLERLFSPAVIAIAVKDLKYFRRDPQLMAMVFQSLFSAVILLALPIINSRSTSLYARLAVSHYLVLYVPLVVLFSMTTFSLNSLGMERQGLGALLLFPVQPKTILWGKNLAVLAIGLVEICIFTLITCILTNGWSFFPLAFFGGLAGIGVVLGCGNFTSVMAPQRMRTMQRGFAATGAASSGGSQVGCLRAITSIAMLFVSFILLIPVAVALILPIFLQAQWIYLISVPLALLYGLGFHQLISRAVASRIVNRTPEILAIVTREQS